MEYQVAPFGSYDFGHAEVGPVDDDGVFLFGMSAEIYYNKALYGEDGYEVTVSFAAIGSHDADTAVQRLRSYDLAIIIARWIESVIDSKGINGVNMILEEENHPTRQRLLRRTNR